ncbi:ribosome maturation factor RimM [Oceaniradius stylonematis]|uniref:Ribosome maturation factor RimM n=1 Tax=Oceaniradius stylonematis TaxID=2184161 RepID=A0A3A8AET9_9HYPH|nr:ribosome maturation factor RimM [Oceaniradius stylonematis]RKF07908.1 ribosome maturation factor RimM [Oceaniradius stylonematis]
MSTKPSNPVLMGVIGAPHGVRGEVRVKSHTGDPVALGDYGPLFDKDGNLFEITAIRPSKTVVVVRFKQVNGREAAEALNGTELFVDRSRLPDGELEDDEFFIDDLVGLDAVDADGARIGAIVAVHNFGADDMIEVRPAGGGRTELYPFTRAVVPEIDMDAGRLTLVAPGEIIARPEEDEAS